MTNLLPMQADSDFFITLFKEMAKIQIIVETFMSDYFIRQRFEMVQARDKQLKLDISQGNNFNKLGSFAGFPSLSYRRKVDNQQRIGNSIMSHLHFVTFQFLDVDEVIYAARLNQELDMWNHKQDLIRSPHTFLRQKAEKIVTPFITQQEELIKFKKEQRYTKFDKEIT